MTILERVGTDLKEAMRAKDTMRLNVLRMLKSALTYAATEKSGAAGSLDEMEAAQVVRKQIKQRHDSIASFKEAKRLELAETEQLEVAILELYLPSGLNGEEVTALVRESIAEAGATSRQQMGAVMKIASAKAAGRVDGRTLSAEVQKLLA